MDLMIAPNSVPFSGADTAPVTGTPQWATEGNPAAGIAATNLRAYQINALMAEITAVIAAAGFPLDRMNNAQLLAALLRSSPLVEQERGFRGSAPGGAKTASFTASKVMLQTVAGLTIKIAGGTFAFNGATTGAGGMDTGTTPTSADLHIYAIYNPTTNTVSTLGTIAGAGADIYPNALPAGYTASALICSCKTDGGGNILQFVQMGRSIKISGVIALTAGTATVLTALSIASIVPVNAKSVSGNLCSGTATANQVTVASTASPGMGAFVSASGSSAQIISAFPGVYMVTAQTIYYYITVASVTGMYIQIEEYSI